MPQENRGPWSKKFENRCRGQTNDFVALSLFSKSCFCYNCIITYTCSFRTNFPANIEFWSRLFAYVTEIYRVAQIGDVACSGCTEQCCCDLDDKVRKVECPRLTQVHLAKVSVAVSRSYCQHTVLIWRPCQGLLLKGE